MALSLISSPFKTLTTLKNNKPISHSLSKRTHCPPLLSASNDNAGKSDDPKKRLSKQSSWEAKDSEGKDYLYRLGKESVNMNIAVGAKDYFLGTDLSRRKAIASILSTPIFSSFGLHKIALAQQPPVVYKEYIDTFDGYSFKYPSNWIQVRGAGADIFFRDPFVLDENLSIGLSSPSSSNYTTIEDLGSPQEAGEKVLKQYLTEFMSTRLGVRRQSSILTTSSRVADDGKMYYEVEVNIKSYANNNELAVMPQDRVASLEWDRRYLSVLGVENKQLYELRLQTPENIFAEEENELRQVMNSFRVNKIAA